nr:MAG TPA: hypothetical protein [Caudoviricetes sp.]
MSINNNKDFWDTMFNTLYETSEQDWSDFVKTFDEQHKKNTNLIQWFSKGYIFKDNQRLPIDEKLLVNKYICSYMKENTTDADSGYLMTTKELQALGDFLGENQDIFTENMNSQTAALYRDSLEWLQAALDLNKIGCEVYIKVVQE